MKALGGTLPAEVSCQGTLTVIAEDPLENLGAVVPNPDFRCDVTTDLCVLSFEPTLVTP